MKYFLIAIILFSTIFIWNDTLVSKQNDQLKELEDMVEAAESNGFRLKTWSMIIREKRQIPNINSFIRNIEGYSFIELTDDGARKFVADGQNKNGANESILIVETGSNQYQIIYEISSLSFTEEVRNYYAEKLSRITNELFTSNAQNFTCIEAVSDDIIDIVCLIKKITKKLQFATQTQLKDKHFTTWTGYTPEWDQIMEIDNQPINAQIALKNTEDHQTTLIIGTPILVTEY
ncbi:TATA-box binding [Gracilibacillus ureilyticus]|uniref:TATA-box binding n=1 Tax=Gracilibacillus ureilyticus TaxID=531814 RepID=A0A1H9UP52_9BACI|nr:YwmB family TATA-box binding protein [Gracilibacillus ureilyticus]SES10897.1 TATA-box binding [Gracilibacillus ureilyticus]